MGFLDDDTEQDGTTSTQEDKYLKLADPDQGKTTEVKIRILDQKPAKVFRHWIGQDPKSQRPYNCPSGRAGCVACHERQALKERGEDARNTHRMDKRYLVNALVFTPEGPKTQIFSFGQKLGEKLDFLHSRHGDLRDFDITVIKRKTGPMKMNVEYDAIFEEKRALTDAEQSIAENRFNLEDEVKPAALDAIAAAVRGETRTSYGSSDGLATADQIKAITELATKKGFKLEDLGVYNTAEVTAERAASLIKALQS